MWGLGYFFLLYLISVPRARTEWSMFRGDISRTGFTSTTGPTVENVRWTIAGLSGKSSPVVDHSGSVYVGTDTGLVVCVDSGGTMLWNYSVGDYAITSTPAIGEGNVVYVAAGSGLHAIDYDGSMIWVFAGAFGPSSPAFSDDGLFIYIAGPGKIYCIDTHKTLQWEYVIPGDPSVISSPAVYTNRIVFGTTDDKIYCLDSNGGLKWFKSTAGQVLSTPAVDAAGMAYVGCNDGFIYCINVVSGDMVWQYDTGSEVRSSLGIIPENTLWTPSPQFIVAAPVGGSFLIIQSNGSLTYEYSSAWSMDTSSPLVAANGASIYVGGESMFYCLRGGASPGLLWSYDIGFNNISSPAISSDGIVYVLGDRLYAFGDSLPTPTPTTAPTSNRCPFSYTYFGGEKEGCFVYISTVTSWSTAQSACRALSNGWLATLDNKAKQDIVTVDFGVSGTVWMGLYKKSACSGSDCVMQTNVIWDTYPTLVASSSMYENFRNLEPNVYNNMCIRIRSNKGYVWADYDCDSPYHYICETSFVNGLCPLGYTSFSGDQEGCFAYFDTSVTWPTAQTNCRALANGWLATIDNPTKNALISDFFEADEDVWIGLYKTAICEVPDCVMQDNMLWDTYPGVNASTSTYEKFMNDEPKDSNELCFNMPAELNHDWADEDCSSQFAYVCETSVIRDPTGQPTGQPSKQPSLSPSSSCPTAAPSTQPTGQPTGQPLARPTTQPSIQPSSDPSVEPSCQPSGRPSSMPSGQPSLVPSGCPSALPSGQPTSTPTTPTGPPSGHPSASPSEQMCPDGYTFFNGEQMGCFAYFLAVGTWETSQSKCRGYSDGWLAALDNAYKQVIPLTLGATGSIWIGLRKNTSCIFSDCVMQRNLFWDTYPGVRASNSSYENFHSTEPDTANDLCIKATISRTSSASWLDASCSTSLTFLCETSMLRDVIPPTGRPTMQPSVALCPPGYAYFSGESEGCYLFVDSNEQWTDARDDCRRRYNGWLVTLDNENKQSIPGDLGVESMIWIGLFKTDVCAYPNCEIQVDLMWDTFPGVSASSSIYENFKTGEPDNSSHMCVVFMNGLWEDKSCESAMPYICQASVWSPPTGAPSPGPTTKPSSSPTRQPTSARPTMRPSRQPTSFKPTVLGIRTATPTKFVPIATPGRPNITNASLSSDGLFISIYFDSDTDRGMEVELDFASHFRCDSLLTFATADSSLCRWDSRRVLVITLYAYDSDAAAAVTPLEYTIRSVMDTVRSYCIYGMDCSELNYASPDVVVAVTPPVLPKSPQVRLTPSSNVISCEPLVLDPTGSTGNAGMAWEDISWIVESSGNGSTLSDFLNNYVSDTDSKIKIPLDVTATAGNFSVTLKLTSILKTYSSASVNISSNDGIVRPVLSITSSSSVYEMYRKNSVNFFALSYVPTCLNFSSNYGLKYDWSVLSPTGYEPTDSIGSLSKDPRRFILPPYSLTSSKTYILRIETSLIVTPTIVAIYEVEIVVHRSYGAVVEVTGGSERTVSSGSTFVIDASSSYHSDDPSARLYYSWSCLVASASSGAYDCGLGELPESAAVEVTAGLFDDLQSWQFTVVVTSDLDTVPRSKTVIVNISPDTGLPVVTFRSVPQKVNPQALFMLNCSVNSGSATYATWSVAADDKGLSQHSTVPTSRNFLPGFNVFPIGVESTFWVPGNRYTFEVSAVVLATGVVSSSQIEVLVNTIPYGGSVSIEPLEGTAMNTTFVMVTHNWKLDADNYPVLYSYSYFTIDASARTLLLAPGTVQEVHTLLPNGPFSQLYVVHVVARIIDVHGTSGEKTVGVTVFPNENVTGIVDFMMAQLLHASITYDTDLTSQIAGGMANVMNSKNCSQAPDCVALNRQSCSMAPHTCGYCLTGYIGERALSNTPCLESSVNEIAESEKMCVNNCSDHGACNRIDSTGAARDTCSVSDPYCHVMCSCDDGYSGEYCEFSSIDIADMKGMRELLCSSYLEAATFSDLSADSVLSRAVFISMMLDDSYQLSEDALNNCSQVLIATIAESNVLAGDVMTMSHWIQAISNALFPTEVLSEGLAARLLNTTEHLALGSQAHLAAGSFYTVVTNNVRLVSAVILSDDAERGQRLEVAKSDIERVSGSNISAVYIQFQMPLVDAITDIGVSLLQYANVHRSDLTLNSTAVVLKTYYYTEAERNTSKSEGDSRRILLELPVVGLHQITNFSLINVNPVDYEYPVSEEIVTRCDQTGAPYVVGINCAGQLGNVTCDGSTAYTVVSTCISAHSEPTCVSWQGDDYSIETDCAVVGFSATTTNCMCNTTHQVAIVDSATSSANQAVGTEEVGSTLTLLAYSFGSRFEEADSLSESSVYENILIFSITTSICVILIVGAFFFLWRDFDNMNDKALADKYILERSIRKRTLQDFVERVIPVQFRDVSWPVRYALVMRRYHSLLAFFNTASTERERYQSLLWVYAIGKIINFLFVGTALAIFLIPDDQNCEGYGSEESCEDRLSVDFENSMCEWDAIEGRCSANTHQTSSFQSTAMICLLINLCAAPLDAMLRYLLRMTKRLLVRRGNEVRTRTLQEYIGNQALSYNPEPFYTNSVSSGSTGSLDDIEDLLKTSVSSSAEQVSPTATVPGGGASLPRSVRTRKAKQQRESYRKLHYERGELWKSQTVLSKTICAIRLSMMQATIDSVDIDVELDLLFKFKESVRNREKLSLADLVAMSGATTIPSSTPGRRSIVPNPTKIGCVLTESVYNRPFFVDGSKQSNDLIFVDTLRERIIEARAEAAELKWLLSVFPDDDYRDVHLIRTFFVDCLTGYRRNVAARFFFAENLFGVEALPSVQDWYNFLRTTGYCYFCTALIPCYLIAFLFYIFLFGVQVGRDSTNVWLLTISISLMEDLLVIETLYIFFIHIVVANAVYKDVVILTRRILGHSKTLMHRVSGQFHPTTSCIQHVSPACRAARKFPRLYASRLLFSLNDFDIPSAFMSRYDSSSVLKRIYLLFRGLLILAFVYVLPEVAQEAVIEVVSSIIVGSLFVVLAFSSFDGASGAVGVLVMIGNLILLGALVFTIKAMLRRWRRFRKFGLNSFRKRSYSTDMKSEVDSAHGVELAPVARLAAERDSEDSFSFESPMHAKTSSRGGQARSVRMHTTVP